MFTGFCGDKSLGSVPEDSYIPELQTCECHLVWQNRICRYGQVKDLGRLVGIRFAKPGGLPGSHRSLDTLKAEEEEKELWLLQGSQRAAAQLSLKTEKWDREPRTRWAPCGAGKEGLSLLGTKARDTA